MDPAQYLADYDDRLTRAATGAQAASASLRQAGGTATSPRGEVAVTVSAGGALDDLRLTPAARALEADQLARLIMTTARQAQREAGAQVAAIMTEHFGEDAALRLVAHSTPPEVGR
ncbi:YbaB/EbfC family nucleoid-associated protein [Saccharothrix deserti]|uniref:YbaB/EbfC family nucleoid-associated protein n=1 Tax=Saccharothrix deserti TaxID=2593674 RepID=UPI00131A95E6|nr:YbaB/EbfC family nucleoid-associated protein [Saccharothrix deserti]